ncbi:hypothetical protein DFH06DRAFT_1208459 [Mycena polygramma]|nr:hypothetical protein DFH06DRAFT_1208459 [Mycena polygramma]
MVRWLISRKSFVRGLATGCFLILSGLVTPVLKSVYPQPGPAAASFFGVCEALVRGYAASAFMLALTMLCALGNSLCGSPPAVALEDGPTESDSESSELPDTATMDLLVPSLSLPGKLSCLARFTYAVAYQWAADDVVSLQRPLCENVLGAALYVFQGLVVLGGLSLVVGGAAWLTRRRGNAEGAAAASVADVSASMCVVPFEVGEGKAGSRKLDAEKV